MIDPREHNSYIKMIDPFVWDPPLPPSRSTNFNMSKTTTNLLQVLSTIFSRRREPPRPFTRFKVHLISTVDRKAIRCRCQTFTSTDSMSKNLKGMAVAVATRDEKAAYLDAPFLRGGRRWTDCWRKWRRVVNSKKEGGRRREASLVFFLKKGAQATEKSQKWAKSRLWLPKKDLIARNFKK